eukprot:SM000073S21480  [mRNA]  locus=s73:517192:519727:+ [translate_table: standard]
MDFTYKPVATPAGGKAPGGLADLELGSGSDMLYPGIGMTDNTLRWGFIRKVYGIICTQLLTTIAVASLINSAKPIQEFVLTNQALLFVALILPFVAMIPLYIYRHSHPLNLACLGVWTVSLSLPVGIACSASKGSVVLEALVLTAAVVLSLTAYTFYAIKKGQDFSFLGPMLFAGLMVLFAWGFLQMFIVTTPAQETVYALIGALLFSLFIIYDTGNMIKRYSYDEYVWASVNMYLNIINLFLRILQILNQLTRNN